MIRAYDEIYLDDAMDTLGSAVEYATLFCGLTGQEFLDLFVYSDVSCEFGRGNIKYISGMSGIELSILILKECGIRVSEIKEIPYADYPPEYWIGWILAYYQWYSGKTFNSICSKLRYDELFKLYGVLHEANPSKSVDVFNAIMKKGQETNLAKLRKAFGLSQSKLAKASGVSVRSIQLYEQRQNNINNAQYNVLKAIAVVLGCNVEDLLE